MKAENDIDKLTEREKQCLRHWLEHKTAKEIALELGVSHHAVEKRLKMARTKLGVSSSLEAARMLAEAEGYERQVAQLTELPVVAPTKHGWTPRPITIVIGVFTMFLCTALALILMQQADPDTGLVTSASPTEATRLVSEETATRIAEMTRRTFDRLDTDESGFLERPESPHITLASLEPANSANGVGTIALSVQPTEGANQETLDAFYGEADQDADGRVSYTEYHQWSAPQLAELGFDVLNGLKPKN